MFVVLTGDQKVKRTKFSTSPRNDHVFTITRSQLFELIGLDESNKAHEKYIKIFDSYHWLYTKALDSPSYQEYLKRRAKILNREMEAMKNLIDGVEVPATSEGYKEFCEEHPNEDIKDLYNDYALPPQDQNLGSEDEEEGGGGLPANFVGDSD
ncbi:MAG: hypothetical protein GF353_08130 [Candidatus Lokiarchaeota archaeon]|nr:hypothetical protein [Candidatus Lokiarchaeota archaeon]